MRWVHIPFTIDGDKLFTPTTQWPQRCACCGESHDGEEHVLTCRLQTSYVDTGVYKSETGYSVGFSVPYCTECKKHANPVMILRVWAYVLGFALWALVGYLLFINGMGEGVVGIGLFLGTGVLLGAGSHVVSKRGVERVSTSKMKATCANNDWALSGSPVESAWRIRFHDDRYANDFAWMNGLDLFAPNDGGDSTDGQGPAT